MQPEQLTHSVDGHRRTRWHAYLAPVVLVVLGVGFALVPLLQGNIFFYWDNAQQQYPQTVFLHQSLRAGVLPQWWPAMGAGTPTVAEGQAAHYHPIRVLFAWLLPPHVAFMGEIALYFTVAGLATYGFLREWRLHRAACMLGGLCQMFGSFSVVFIRNAALHRGLGCLPLAMFLAERFVRRRQLSYGLAASLVFGLQFLTGYPTVAFITIIGTTLYLVCRVLQRAWYAQASLRETVQQLSATLGQWVAIVVLGFGIAAIQIVPTFLHTGQSIRQGGLDFEYAIVHSMPARLEYLAQLLLPYAYAQGDWLPTAQWDRYHNVTPISGIYLGALPVLLAWLGWWWRRPWPHPAWPLTICLLTAMAFALGAKTPLFPALWSLPGLNGLRFPSRFLLLAAFCLASLAAFGCHAVLVRSRLYRLRGTRLQTGLPLVLLASTVVVLAAVFWTQAAWLAQGINLAADLPTGLLLSVALMLGACVVVWGLFATRQENRRWLVILTLGFVCFDLWLFRHRSGYAPTVALATVLAPPPVVEFLHTDTAQFRVMSLTPDEQGRNRNADLRELLQANLSMLWGIDSADVYFSLMLKRYHLLHEGLIWELLNTPATAARLADFLGALNVKYVVAPLTATLQGWHKVHETAQAATWQNPRVLPRAFVVGHIVPEAIETRDEWFMHATYKRLERQHMMVSNWYTRVVDAQIIDNILTSPHNYQNTAIVTAPTGLHFPGVPPEAIVHTLPTHTNSMRFQVHSRQPGFLVVASNYYPGWTARVNGQPTPLYRTNYVSMGLPVPAGDSDVTLQFVTPGVRLGALVTVCSFGLWVAGCFLTRHAQATRRVGL